MEGGEGNRDSFGLSVGMNGISSDLVQKLMKRSYNQDGSEQDEDDEGELELSLGLSMNGRFGVDPTRKKLKRSSSISNLVFAVGAAAAADGGSSRQDLGAAELETFEPLARARSLPTEVEEEWRRRKEFQSMRRMEARKKRMEKLRNVRVLQQKDLHEVGSKNNVCGQRIDNGIVNKFENGNEISSSQGSIGSQRSGSGSSGISDLEFEGGMNQKNNVPPPMSRPSQDQNEQEPASRAADRNAELPNKSLKNAMFDMPIVSTKADRPNGHKIEGFLYNHKKGEEVRIVCVCHGKFLTPAEFVKHGGGGDVEHPLKHIVVNPFPLL